jgi:hypothetical protein
MKTLFRQAGLRAAISLIAAYAVALQAVFATLAPVPVGVAGLDFGHVICFGGDAAPPDGSDPSAPAPASGKFHCVLCGSAMAGAAVLPEPASIPRLAAAAVEQLQNSQAGAVPSRASRTGPARAPPHSV